MCNLMCFNVALYTVVTMRNTFSNVAHICVPFDSHSIYELFVKLKTAVSLFNGDDFVLCEMRIELYIFFILT